MYAHRKKKRTGPAKEISSFKQGYSEPFTSADMLCYVMLELFKNH